MRVKQTDRAIKLEEGQGEDRGRRHAVGQEPEKQMLVAEEGIAAESIGRRQGYQQGDSHIHDHIGHGIEVAHVPRRVCQDGRVVAKGQVMRPEGEAV